MDGLLIDSEDLYTLCTNDILHKYNKEDLPWSVKAQLQGRPSPEVILQVLTQFTACQLSSTSGENSNRMLTIRGV